MSFLLVAQRALTVPGWAKDALWRSARAIPSLDLPFADSKSLVDAITGRQLISYARAGGGAYTDSAGVLRTATTNLLLRSEEFNDASWTKTGFLAFGSGSTANATTAPNNTLTSDLLTESTALSERTCYQSGFTTTTSATLSCYIKPNGRNFAGLRFYAANNNWVRVTFTLTGSGSASAIAAGSSSDYSTTSASITAAENGWYRVSLSATRAGGVSYATIDFATSASPTLYAPLGNELYTGNGTSGIYLWGAQLEQSSTVGEYVPTGSTINSAPRFDHNPLTGESLGLLVEEQRTNFMLNSGGISANVALGTGTVIGPDAVNCRTLIPNAGSQNFPNIGGPLQSFTLASGQTIDWAWSGWVAAGPTGTVPLEPRFVFGVSVAGGASPTYAELQINTSNGTIRSKILGFSLTDVSAPTVTLYRSGLYRFTWVIRYTQDATGRNTVSAGMQMRTTGGAGTYTADGVSGVQYALLQAETGSTVSSTIPTTTAAATRNADVAQITGTNFSSWYRQDEGTWFTEGAVPPGLSVFPTLHQESDGTGNNVTSQYVYTNGYYTNVRVGNVGQGDPGVAATLVVGAAYKIASGLRVDNAVTAANGALGTTDTSLLMPTALSEMRIGANRTGGAVINTTIKRLVFWPQALPGQLAAITQP